MSNNGTQEDVTNTNKTEGLIKTGKPFRPVRAPARGKPGRGNVNDPNVICDALLETWTEFSEALNKIPDDEKAQLAAHFNDLSDEDPELGEVLFGDLEEFKAHLEGLSDAVKG